jgi:pSer/pThr/pTyr-binding forkhead associated (FHA) protein
MKTCESCGADVSSGLLFCPNCGRRLPGDVVLSAQMTGIQNRPTSSETAYLEFLGGPEDGRIVRLSGERVTVGRREDNDVQIFSDTALSRRHAFLYYKDSQFWIEDRRSSFGTWVDGERVPVETAAPMRDGCLVRLAHTMMLFHLGEPEEVELRETVSQVEL